MNNHQDIKYKHNNVISKCKLLWKALKSPNKREKLDNFLGCKLKRAVITRWNSLFDALTQILSLKAKLLNYELFDIVELTISFVPSDFNYIAEYLICHKQLAVAIDILQGQKDCQYGYLLPTLLIIRNKWRSLIAQNQLEVYLLCTQFKAKWISVLDEDAVKIVKNLMKEIMRLENTPVPRKLQNEEDDFFTFEDFESSLIHDNFIPHCREEDELTRFLNNPSSSLDILKDTLPSTKYLLNSIHRYRHRLQSKDCFRMQRY